MRTLVFSHMCILERVYMVFSIRDIFRMSRDEIVFLALK
jgi:hypothetical protein